MFSPGILVADRTRKPSHIHRFVVPFNEGGQCFLHLFSCWHSVSLIHATGTASLWCSAKRPSVKVQEKLTEQSDWRVWMQPELSLRTQQPVPLSKSLSFWMRLTIWGSWCMQGENLAPKWIRTSWKMVGIWKVKKRQHLKHSQEKNAPIPADALPSGPDKGGNREEGQYLEKSVQHRRGLQPNSSTATGDQPQTHRTGTNPHVFHLGVLDVLVTDLVLLHLQGATEQHCWLVCALKELQVFLELYR